MSTVICQPPMPSARDMSRSSDFIVWEQWLLFPLPFSLSTHKHTFSLPLSLSLQHIFYYYFWLIIIILMFWGAQVSWKSCMLLLIRTLATLDLIYFCPFVWPRKEICLRWLDISALKYCTALAQSPKWAVWGTHGCTNDTCSSRDNDQGLRFL